MKLRFNVAYLYTSFHKKIKIWCKKKCQIGKIEALMSVSNGPIKQEEKQNRPPPPLRDKRVRMNQQ